MWTDLVGFVAKHLPNLDMAINTVNKRRLLIPWEDMKEYAFPEQGHRMILAPGTLPLKYNGRYMATSLKFMSADILRPIHESEAKQVLLDNSQWNGTSPTSNERVIPALQTALLAQHSLEIDFSDPPIPSTDFMKPQI